MTSSKVRSNDARRLFLQAAMSRRVMTEKMTKILWQKCAEAVSEANPALGNLCDGSDASWGEFVNEVNDVLDPLSLEFKTVVDEVTGAKTWAIINTKGDEVAQLASDYSPIEISFFKAVVEQIVLAKDYTFSISSLAALRELSHLKGTMSKAQGENMLDSFVARGWLIKSKRGRYSLAPRSILELNAYLKSTYDQDDIIECTICFEIITKGIRCATPNCRTYLHKHCYEVLARTNRNICPTCQASWSNEKAKRPLGEEAAKDGQDERRKVRRANSCDDDEAGDSSQYLSQTLPESEQSQSQAQTQSQSQSQSQRRNGRSKKAQKKSSKKRDVTPDSDEEEEESEAMDIDDLNAIREKPSRIHRRA